MRPRYSVPALLALLLLLGGVLWIADLAGTGDPVLVAADGEEPGNNGTPRARGSKGVAVSARPAADARLSVTQFFAFQIIRDGSPTLGPGLAKDGLGLRFANAGNNAPPPGDSPPGGTDNAAGGATEIPPGDNAPGGDLPPAPGGPAFQLQTLTLAFSVTDGPPLGARQMEAQVFIDADGSGHFDQPGSQRHAPGEVPLTEFVALPALRRVRLSSRPANRGPRERGPQATEMTFTLAPFFDARFVDTPVAPIVPAGEQLTLGLFVQNAGVEKPARRVRIRFVSATGFFLDESATAASVPDPPANAVPENDVVLVAQPEDCGLTCGAWNLCVLVDLKWTEGDGTADGKNDHLVNNQKPNCAPQQEQVLATASKGCTIENGGTASVGDGDDAKIVLLNATPTVAADKKSLSVTIEPKIGGEQSMACKDTEVSITAVTLKRASDDKEFTKVSATCAGTVFAMRIFPVIPRDAPCVREMEKRVAKSVKPKEPSAAVKEAFKYPAGEAPDPVGSKNAPVTRVDPRLIYLRAAPEGGDRRAFAQAALAVLKDANVIEDAANAACILPACANVCLGLDPDDAGAVVFQYRVTPAVSKQERKDGCVPPTLTVSQFEWFDDQGVLKAVPGRIAIVRDDDFIDPGSSFKPGKPDSNTTKFDGSVDIKSGDAGRDVTNIESGSFVYLRPVPRRDADGNFITDEYTNLVVFSACDRPIAAIELGALERLTIPLCFHFFDNDGKKKKERTQLVNDFVARANELLGQCCIGVRAVLLPSPKGGPSLNHTVIDSGVLTDKDFVIADRPTQPGEPNGAGNTVNQLRNERVCHGNGDLNVFLVPGKIRFDTGGPTIFGAAFSSERAPGHDPTDPSSGGYSAAAGDKPGSAMDRLIVISLGAFAAAPDGSLAALRKGRNLACATTLAHEIGHALGLSTEGKHPDDATRVMGRGSERVETGVGADDEKLGTRFRDPKQQRFNCQSIAGKTDPDGKSENECARLREAMKKLRATPTNWSFNS